MITFCFDRVADKYTGYPNLARWSAEPYTEQWRQFDQHWPYCVPCRLLMYFRYTQIRYRVCTVESAEFAYYPIAFGWFDFSCDYVGLLSEIVKLKCRERKIKLLFYYHEGDNPAHIKKRIDQLIKNHNMPSDCYIFLSANTAADNIENFCFFNDHEFFFRHVNRNQESNSKYLPRDRDFTLLSRTHKWWRASVVEDLVNSGLLDNSFWSYYTAETIENLPEDNPIELDQIEGWRQRVSDFVDQGPYTCDHFDLDQQNNHHIVNRDLYNQSNIHIILETHFDADQSNGAFITEKTYKAIKYGQPFVIVGTVGTLAQLKKQGYRTFDHVIDSSYDSITNNTERWYAIKKVISDLHSSGSNMIYQQCINDIKHNQQNFSARTSEPLNTMRKELLCQIK